MGDCKTSTLLSLQHLVLLVWAYSRHFSQTNVVQYVRSTGSQSEASLMKMPTRYLQKKIFLQDVLFIFLLTCCKPQIFFRKTFQPIPEVNDSQNLF